MSDGLADLLDRLVDTGVATAGDVTLSVAGVDLIQLRLQALLASIGTEGGEPIAFAPRPRRALPQRIDTSEQTLDRGLAQLVLAVVEILSEVMERQAVRRLSAGTLTDDEVERLGRTFSALRERIADLEERLATPAALEVPPFAPANAQAWRGP